MCKGEYLEFMLLFLRKTERGRANIRAKSDVLVALTGSMLQIMLHRYRLIMVALESIKRV